MAADFAAHATAILTANPLVAVTSGTLAQGVTTQTAAGSLIGRRRDADPLSGVVEERALLLLDAAQLTTVTRPDVHCSWTVSGEGAWRVVAASQRQGHWALEIARSIQPGTV